jgi:Right handed beta helix region
LANATDIQVAGQARGGRRDRVRAGRGGSGGRGDTLAHGLRCAARRGRERGPVLPDRAVPQHQARNVEVSGFTVVHAGFDAILVARSHHVLVQHNLLIRNGDVGVDFNGTTDSLARRNVSEFNQGGGFLIADDLGTTHGNAVTWNIARRNPGGCGVIVAGHSTAGVWGNYIAHNVITFNGLNPKSAGAGVVIATEVEHERVSGNVVMGNVIHGNGLSGVTIHAHEPFQNLNGQIHAVIRQNRFHRVRVHIKVA